MWTVAVRKSLYGRHVATCCPCTVTWPRAGRNAPTETHRARKRAPASTGGSRDRARVPALALWSPGRAGAGPGGIAKAVHGGSLLAPGASRTPAFYSHFWGRKAQLQWRGCGLGGCMDHPSARRSPRLHTMLGFATGTGGVGRHARTSWSFLRSEATWTTMTLGCFRRALLHGRHAVRRAQRMRARGTRPLV